MAITIVNPVENNSEIAYVPKEVAYELADLLIQYAEKAPEK